MHEFLKQLFRKKDNSLPDFNIDLQLNQTDQQVIKDFYGLTDDERFKEIIILAETGDFLYAKVIQYAILHDQDINVRFAALKRIHLWEEFPAVKPMMSQLKMIKQRIQ